MSNFYKKEFLNKEKITGLRLWWLGASEDETVEGKIVVTQAIYSKAKKQFGEQWAKENLFNRYEC